MSERVANLLQTLTQSSATHHDPAQQQSKDRFEFVAPSWLAEMDAVELLDFFRGLLRSDQAARDGNAHRIQVTLRALSTAAQSARANLSLDDDTAHVVVELYTQWRESSLPRHLLLALLIAGGHATAWQGFAQLIVTDPPRDTAARVEAFAPLWRRPIGPFHVLFPALFPALEHADLAVIVLDLANFLFRSGRMRPHPGAERAAQFVTLLGAIVERLETFEATSSHQGVPDLGLARQVTESVDLAVALCDTLALLDCRDATGKLYRMLELSHRRVRTEAATALARLGEPAGIDALVALAAEPVVRLRVHAYASELGILEKIPESQRTPRALGEAELVSRLSERDQFGLPPNELEFVDERELYWPGYETPQQCLLFRYRYEFPQGVLENIALARPVAQALAADLTELSIDDLYAVYAGWHVEHPELQRLAIDPTLPDQAREVARGVQRLRQAGYQSLRPALIGNYFGLRLLIAEAIHQDTAGTAIVGPDNVTWIPASSTTRPLDPETAFHLYVGRDLLSRFNPEP